MKFEAAKKKLERYGYKVTENGNSYSHRYLYYYATKANSPISQEQSAVTFHFDTVANRITNIKVRHNEEKSVSVSSLNAALRETGDLKLKMGRGNPLKERIRTLTHHGRGLRVSDEEVLALNLHTSADAESAMAEAFPILKRINVRETRRGRSIRSNLYRQCTALWLRAVEAYKVAFPDRPPLRRVSVRTHLDKPTGCHLEYYQETSVSGDMVVFAWDAKEATQTVRMMLGEFASVTDCGIVAIGDRKQALSSYNRLANGQASTNVKKEIRRLEEDLEETKKRMENIQKRLEFSQKKMEVASFIDGVGNMASMVDGVS